MQNKKKSFKEKIIIMFIGLDYIFYKFISKIILWRVKKTNTHKYKVYRKLMVIEAQIMFYCVILLPIFLCQGSKAARIIIMLIFIIMIGAVYWWRFKKNEREIKAYDAIWDRRNDESVQAREKIKCVREITWFFKLRIFGIMMLLFVMLWYNTIIISSMVQSDLVCEVIRMFAMNIYFLSLFIEYYLDIIYDLGGDGKVKEKKEMTETQKASWRRLLETFNPAPTN